MKRIHHIVLTGGPCAGKTSAIATIVQDLTQKGYTVFVVPETATEHIKSGYAPWMECTTNYDFQRFVLKKQLNKELLYTEIAESVSAEKIVIIYDRGIVDGKSYITDEEFSKILVEFGLNNVSAKSRYDAVLHLVTAAKGAREFYTLSNNEARTESPKKAIELDELGIKNWTGHPHLRIIDNSTDFKGKLRKVLSEVYAVLGDPVPLEIEHKYLIEKPNLEDLSGIVQVEVIDILQTYLISAKENAERRIRQFGKNGNYSYYYTEKREISSLKRAEVERRITQEEYLRLMAEADTTLHQISKKRACFVYGSQYFELDIYPNTTNNIESDQAILEIEVTEDNSEIKIPSFIKIIKEVTEDFNYRNYAFAKK